MNNCSMRVIEWKLVGVNQLHQHSHFYQEVWRYCDITIRGGRRYLLEGVGDIY